MPLLKHTTENSFIPLHKEPCLSLIPEYVNANRKNVIRLGKFIKTVIAI